MKLRINGASGFSAGLEDAEVEAGMSEGEAAIAAAETATDVAEIESDLTNATRLEDQAEGMEDAAEVIDGIERATPGEVQLADVASSLATAGTDAEVEIFEDAPEGEAVSVESFTNRKIGTEGLKEMAQKFWAEVKRLVAKAWEAILKFWRKVTDQVPGVVKAARSLRTRAEDAAGKSLKSEDKKLKAGSAGLALVLGDSYPTSAGDVTKAVENMTAVAKIVLDADAKSVHEGGEALQSAINDFDVEKAEESLKKVTDKVKAGGFGQSGACKTAIGSDSRYGNGLTATKSVDLPGGVILVASKAPNESNGGLLGWAAALRSQSVAVVHHNDKDKKSITEKDVTTLSLQEIKKVADQAEDLALVVKGFQEKHLRKLEQASNKMKGAGDKVAKQVTEETPALAQKQYQAALRFVTAYAAWSASPFNRIAQMSLTTARAAIEVGNKSVGKYSAA
jgi:hypothetical protein